jgi:hypothetical protein
VQAEVSASAAGQGERLGNAHEDGVGLGRQLLPRHALDVHAGSVEDGVAAAVAVEALRRGMEGVAIDLDHETLGRPKEVDLVTVDNDVDAGRRQLARLDQRAKSLLSFRPRARRIGVVPQKTAQPARSRASPVAIQQVQQRIAIR